MTRELEVFLFLYLLPALICIVIGKLSKRYEVKELLGVLSIIPAINIVGCAYVIVYLGWKFIYDYVTE